MRKIDFINKWSKEYIYFPFITYSRIIRAIFIISLFLIPIFLVSPNPVDERNVLIVSNKDFSYYSKVHDLVAKSFNKIDVVSKLPSKISGYDSIILLNGLTGKDSDQLYQYVKTGGGLVFFGAQILFLRQNESSLEIPNWLGFHEYTNGGNGTAHTIGMNVVNSLLDNYSLICENYENNYTAGVKKQTFESNTKVQVISKWYNDTTYGTGDIFAYTKEWLNTNGRLVYIATPFSKKENLAQVNLDKLVQGAIHWSSKLIDIQPTEPSTNILSINNSQYFGGLASSKDGIPGSFSQIDLHKLTTIHENKIRTLLLEIHLSSSQALGQIRTSLYLANQSIEKNWTNGQLSIGNISSKVFNEYLGEFNISFSSSRLYLDISNLIKQSTISNSPYLLIENPTNSDILISKVTIVAVNYVKEKNRTFENLTYLVVFFSGILVILDYVSNYIIVDEQRREREQLTISLPEEKEKTFLPEKLVEILDILWSPLETNNLSLKESEILLFLKAKPNYKLAIKEIKQELKLEAQILTYRTNQLVKKGFIKKINDVNDTRIIVCQLTDKGLTFVDELSNSFKEISENLK